MKINVGEQLSTTVYLVPEGTKLEMISDEAAQYALNHLKFKGNLNEKFIYLGPNTDNIVVIGLGHLDHLTKDHYVQAAYTAAKVMVFCQMIQMTKPDNDNVLLFKSNHMGQSMKKIRFKE